MEVFIIILILGSCLWMLIRHALKSIGWIFRLGFLFILGLVAIGALLYFLLHDADTQIVPTHVEQLRRIPLERHLNHFGSLHSHSPSYFQEA